MNLHSAKSFVSIMAAFAAASWIACARPSQSKEPSMPLPSTVSSWVRSDTVQTVTDKTIFDYMDGAGELYLGYRFDRLDVSTYRMPGQDDIVVERYFMKSPDDAFGLLSLDWSGEPAPLAGTDRDRAWPASVPRTRALYSSGLLRLWSGCVYARIMAYRETPPAREAVFALGRACVTEGDSSAVPAWMQSPPETLPGAWTLEKDQVRFLRTHLVLNSVLFLGYDNLLGLDLSDEVAAGRYRLLRAEPGDSAAAPTAVSHLIAVRYASASAAGRALSEFHRLYYPESPLRPGKEGPAGSVLRLTEGKWSGYRLIGAAAILGFEFPDGPSLENALDAAVRHIHQSFGG
jgi:hypothetical protein